MPEILDGKKARDSYKQNLIREVQALLIRPTLALIQIGNNKESSIYITQKKKFADEIDARVEHIIFKESATVGEIQATIRTLNENKTVHGIIVQLPLPQHLNASEIINTIVPEKDVDGLVLNNTRFVPATAKAVMSLLEFYNISVKDKKVVVFGRSRLVGSPVALLMRAQGAHVTVIHSQTSDPKTLSKHADIVIVAIGKAGIIDASYLQKGAIVIDVGINSVAGKLVGDVDHESVAPLVKAISPVPGGVGPMTVLSLFANLILSAHKAAVK